MEVRDGAQARPPKNQPKQRCQGKLGSGGRTHKAASHDEELAAQLAKIEKELRRKERKLEKYKKVLRAKEHVRNTVRRHSAASEDRDTATTGQKTPPHPAKPCSSRSVTFSSRSPEVQYVTTHCHTPTNRDRDTTPPPPPPPPPHTREGQDVKSEVTTESRPCSEGAVAGRGCAVEYLKDVAAVCVDVPVREGSTGSRDTGTLKEGEEQGSIDSKTTRTFRDRQDDGSTGSKNTGTFRERQGKDLIHSTNTGMSREREERGSTGAMDSRTFRERQEQYSSDTNTTGVPQGEDTSKDASLSSLRNEEVYLCVQAIIEDTEGMEYDAEVSNNLSSTHPGQGGHSSRVTETANLPGPDSTSDPVLSEGYDQCFDDWLPLPSPDTPTPDPPPPSRVNEQYPASKAPPDRNDGAKLSGSSPSLLSAGTKHCGSISKSLLSRNADAKVVPVSSESLPGLNTDAKHCYSSPKSLPGPTTNTRSSESTPTSLPGLSTSTRSSKSTPMSLPGLSTNTRSSESTPTQLPAPTTKHLYSPKPLPCHQASHSTETSGRHQNKMCSDGSAALPTPLRTATQGDSTALHLKQHTLAGEKPHATDFSKTHFPDEAVQRSCVTRHRWRNRALQSSAESSGSTSKRNSADLGKLRKKVRGIIEETQDLVLDEEKEGMADGEKQGNDGKLMEREHCQALELVREIIQETEDMIIDDEGEEGMPDGGKRGNGGEVKKESLYVEGDMREVIEETEEMIMDEEGKEAIPDDKKRKNAQELMKKENCHDLECTIEIIEETEDMIIDEEGKEPTAKDKKQGNRGRQTQAKTDKYIHKFTKGPKHLSSSQLTSPPQPRHEGTLHPGRNTHRGREGGENCHTSQGRRVNEMRTQAGPNNPPCGRTDSTNTTTIKNTKDAAQYNPYSKTAKTGKKLIPDNKKTKNTQLELEDPPDTTGRTSPARRTQKHTTMQDKTDTDSTDSTDKSILSFTSSIPSARLVEGPQGTEVEAWTVPVEEGHGVLLTTALATTATSCVLLVVQECGLGLWRPSAGGWTLVGETQHSIRNIGDIR